MPIHDLNPTLFVGIDISKNYYDAAAVDQSARKIKHRRFNNHVDNFQEIIDWVKSIYAEGIVIFCMEHTGVYSRLLSHYLVNNGHNMVMQSGYAIKHSLGVVKGKSDKIDAYRIAEYALSFKHKLNLYTSVDSGLTLLHDLLTTRSRFVRARNALLTPVKELQSHGGELNHSVIDTCTDPAIKGINESIKAIDQKTKELIAQHPEWSDHLKLATSVKGIGQTAALWMMVYTDNFSTEMNARKFASLIGVAPFLVESGSSVRKGSHNSHHSHKHLKGLFHSCVMSAIKASPRIKAYHKRKKEENKKGFVVMNAIKNKLIQTVFAVVRSGVAYDEQYVHPLAS